MLFPRFPFLDNCRPILATVSGGGVGAALSGRRFPDSFFLWTISKYPRVAKTTGARTRLWAIWYRWKMKSIMSLSALLDNGVDAVAYGTPAAVPKRSRITGHQGESLVVKDVDEFRTESNHSK